MLEYEINEYLKLRKEDGKVNIYVKDELFIQCKHLFIRIPKEKIIELENINSVDEVAEKQDILINETFDDKIGIDEEFWAHCSNLQVWAENDYDSRLLHSNLAFPLLKKLSESGDIKALRVFKEEIIDRFYNGTKKVQEYLINEGYLNFLTDDERFSLITSEKDLRNLQSLEREMDTKFQILANIEDFEKINYAHHLKSFVIRQGKVRGLRLCQSNIERIPKIIKNFGNLEKFSI